MEWVETTGPTIDEAKEAALDKLGVDAQDAEFEILEEPKLGLFGRVRSEGRVRARVRPSTPRAKEDRRDRRRRDRSSQTRSSEPTPEPVPSAPLPVLTPQPEAADDPPRRRNQSARAGGRTPTRTRQNPKPMVAATEPTESSSPNEGDSLMDVALDQQADVASTFVTGLLERFGSSAQLTVTTSEEEDRIEIRVDGDNLGLLIGPKGSTLLAIQDLTRTFVQHRTSARNGRIHVDVSGYREKRSRALATFAEKIASDVLRTGRPVALEPMSSPDRKVVHDTVARIAGVESRSEGEDERRHVVLSLASGAADQPGDDA